MNDYLIIDVKKSSLSDGEVWFFSADLRSATVNLDCADRVPESVVNRDLDRYDNGATTRAVLTSRIQQWLSANNYLLKDSCHECHACN